MPSHPDSLRPRRRFLVAAVGALAAFVGPPGRQDGVARAASSPLPPEQAFRFYARAVDAKTIEARFAIADGYYLYRDKFRFSAAPSFGLVVPELPEGTPKEDPFFGRVAIFRREFAVRLALPDGVPGDAVVVQADSQGCADIGLCDPVSVQKVTLSLPKPGAGPGPFVDATPLRRTFP